ncbi:hypothetical protein HLRTI_001262 [Halorhabdus tiamatea SARL4B]|uniref:Archaeal Type IV pilin N-terminal domain-containing protein n=1 Tax=Halorhabdus tiamatea SARL4B TaxID=1033806 RepID=F7PGT4_9EURY|nr:type IV pilin N-terminal domain-containing protein [Halorhabdus tiamatea]ERJ06707.1 hypothetical protein HLRTI_001262 [Halorhabdus tiamatea SARL4B]CCQ33897.1 conserved hypothetical protein (DUF1628) [Halorhabdus tiamatea SARL4B]
MKLKTFLFDEDRGVSPVIGVILMVAITVILAAVIATFVMNMGPSEEQAPTSSWDFEYNSTLNFVNVTHDGGQDAVKSEISFSESVDTDFPDDTISAGDRAIIDVSSLSSGDTLEVIWNSDEEDKSDVLATYEIP